MHSYLRRPRTPTGVGRGYGMGPSSAPESVDQREEPAADVPLQGFVELRRFDALPLL